MGFLVFCKGPPCNKHSSGARVTVPSGIHFPEYPLCGWWGVWLGFFRLSLDLAAVQLPSNSSCVSHVVCVRSAGPVFSGMIARLSQDLFVNCFVFAKIQIL